MDDWIRAAGPFNVHARAVQHGRLAQSLQLRMQGLEEGSWVARAGLSGNVCGVRRKGKRSALVDHQSKNREHRQLADALAPRGPQVALVAGMAQRLPGKVAIVTGAPFASHCSSGYRPLQLAAGRRTRRISACLLRPSHLMLQASSAAAGQLLECFPTAWLL